jgi:hypothetical protein
MAYRLTAHFKHSGSTFLNIRSLYLAHIAYLYVVHDSKNKQAPFSKNINRLVSLLESHCVYCGVGTEFFYTV